jgi:Uma2 family endonuclease
MSRAPQKALLTVEDLYTLPDDGLRHELVAGTLISEPNPGARHGRVMIRVASLLSGHARARNLGVVLGGDAGFVLARSPDTMRGPDVSFVSRERFEKVGDVETAFPGPPDLAVEILSPHDRPGEVRAKVADYLTAGTKLVWVVDPSMGSVTVYRSLFAPRALSGEDRLEADELLPGFTCSVAEIFEI